MIKFTSEQIESEKKLLQKKVFYLLLIVDPDTTDKYPNVDVEAAFDDIFSDLDGLNELFSYPAEIINVAKKLAKALKEFRSSDFEYKRYRKFILDAGNEVTKIGQGGD